MLKETIALPRGVELTAKILSFLAADDDRLDHFFSTTGHDIGSVRDEAQSPAFLEALIDYVLGEDARVMALAEYLDMRPEVVAGLKSRGEESAPRSQTSDKPSMPPRRLFAE